MQQSQREHLAILKSLREAKGGQASQFASLHVLSARDRLFEKHADQQSTGGDQHGAHK